MTDTKTEGKDYYDSDYQDDYGEKDKKAGELILCSYHGTSFLPCILVRLFISIQFKDVYLVSNYWSHKVVIKNKRLEDKFAYKNQQEQCSLVKLVLGI